MTASELRYQIERAGTCKHYFTRQTMRFHGDTMRNYGVCSAKVDSWFEEGIDCWELYRKKPVKHGIWESAYFRKDSYKRVHRKITYDKKEETYGLSI
jgi:hypothetical protein